MVKWVFPTSARLLFVQSHGAAWLADAEGNLPGPGPGHVQHCWQSAAQVLQHEGMPPRPGMGVLWGSCAFCGNEKLREGWEVEVWSVLGQSASHSLSLTEFQVEEAAFLLQIHEKGPPPRGPFPWAEGDLTPSASNPGFAS